MKRILNLLTLSLLLLANLCVAQNLKWDAELRIRTEIDNRDFKNSTPPNYFTLSRARLGAEFIPIENIKLYLQIQDSRVWGEEKDNKNNFNTISNTKNLDLHQAFIQVDKFIFDNITLKIGRQRLSYGNERFVGVVAWNNIGRVFDGGLIRYELPKHKFDLFVMNIGETNIPPSAAVPAEVKFERDYGQLFTGINYTTKYIQNHIFEIYTYHQLNKNVSVPGYNDLSRFTSGVYGKGSIFNRLSYETDFAYQYGWKKGISISAYFLGFTLSYGLDNSVISNVSLSLERSSGTKSTDQKYKTFETLYGTGHKFFGYMDYFINLPLHTDEKGIQDIFCRINFNLFNNLKSHLVLHNFNLSEALMSETSLGQELDIVLNWKYNDFLNFEFGGGLFLPGKIMQKRFDAYDVSQWGYATITLLL